MKKFIIEYLPDTIIITGIGILSYNILRPVEGLSRLNFIDNHIENKVFGILLIAIGLDIVIRKYYKRNNK